MPTSVLDRLREHSRELRELDVGAAVARVPAEQFAADPGAFVRDYVARNKPAILTGAIDHWPALGRWADAAYLSRVAGEALVSVDVTPNGRGDAVTPLPPSEEASAGSMCFCMPQQRRMTLSQFFELLHRSQDDEAGEEDEVEEEDEQEGEEGKEEVRERGREAEAAADGEGLTSGRQVRSMRRRRRRQRLVPYLSHQNSNLSEQLAPLLRDVDGELPLAAAAFGAPPDAVNIWIGDARAASTFHKDHYENFYAVVVGSKTFHLLPPTDSWRLSLATYPAAEYQEVNGRLRPVLTQPRRSVQWCPVDPRTGTAAAAQQHPHFFAPSLPPPLVAEVEAGEVLYLPAMWHHYVEQSGGLGDDHRWTVAVNYWHDMAFDARYAAAQLVEALARDQGLLPPVPPAPPHLEEPRLPLAEDEPANGNSTSRRGSEGAGGSGGADGDGID